jgi:hypothetical protein
VPINGVDVRGTADISLVSPGGHQTPFNYKSSIFSKLKDIGINSSILGFYHPYCSVFSGVDCVAYPMQPNYKWYSGLASLYAHTRIISLFNSRHENATDYMSFTTNHQLAKLPNFIADNKSSFKFIHLNIPHLPGYYAQEMLSRNVSGNDPNYLLNLEFSDLVLKSLLKAVDGNKGRESLLILTSDHWYRGKSHGNDNVSPALFIAKISSDNQAAKLTSPTSSIYVQGIVSDFFTGKIKTHREMQDYFLGKNYHQTLISKKSYIVTDFRE